MNGVAPGEITLHPGPNGPAEYAILRFTASIAGMYDVTATYKTGDTGQTEIWFVRNGMHLNYDDNTTGGGTFVHTLNLGVGDNLDLVVGNAGTQSADFFSDNTPVNMHLETEASEGSVPEPATMTIWGLGALGAFVAYRRRSGLAKA